MLYILKNIFLIKRLILWYNESVRLRNKFAHGDSVGKKLNIQSKWWLAKVLKPRAALSDIVIY